MLASRPLAVMRSFSEGDLVRFHITGIYNETATYGDRYTRARYYFHINVYNWNGNRLLKPASLEVGMHQDETEGLLTVDRAGNVFTNREDLCPEHLWEATLMVGIRRAQAENAGKILPLGAAFLDPATLRGTDEVLPWAQSAGFSKGATHAPIFS